ncbi:WD repeat protein [Tritrichomonas foetus]|uniref:WD repeat protein n=1 Tax=Tritrichomonas foetus TaxID=1144522 RepID=A0A1J4K8L0_9EUKA|nr:WD repeat protein [Tritrichomonas foetus]|eukprot:OHT05765.1 WD repeat protein [Tritrichomonas foetus]
MSEKKKLIDRNEWFIPDDKEKYEEYLRGADDDEPEDVKNFQLKRELAHHRSDVVTAARGAVRSEMLQTVDQGYVEDDTYLSQKSIQKEIPIAIASRKFDFDLPNGPYHADVTLNGRTILLGGSGGHFASFDWYNGNKFFELYPEAEVRDVTFLYDDTLCAMATQKLVYIHDKQGVQIHELTDHKRPLFITFLRQHWLLVSASENGRLTYSDVTDGKTVAKFRTKRGTPTCMCYNRHNGVVSLGHTNGVVSFWTPNAEEPAATVFTHPSPLTSIDVDISGKKLATAGCDGSVRIWDLRNFDRVYSRSNDKYSASNVSFSASGVLGVVRGVRCEFFKEFNAKKPYLACSFKATVKSLKFVTFDDFAIVGHDNGISSVIVPGSGEPNIDSNVANPFATTEWRQEQEVRGLLDKIPYDMITMDIDGPIQVGRPVDKQKERAAGLKKHRMIKETSDKDERKGGTKEKRVSMEQKIRMMKEAYNKQLIEEKMKKKETENAEEEPSGPLARFKKAKESRH